MGAFCKFTLFSEFFQDSDSLYFGTGHTSVSSRSNRYTISGEKVWMADFLCAFCFDTCHFHLLHHRFGNLVFCFTIFSHRLVSILLLFIKAHCCRVEIRDWWSSGIKHIKKAPPNRVRWSFKSDFDPTKPESNQFILIYFFSSSSSTTSKSASTASSSSLPSASAAPSCASAPGCAPACCSASAAW